MVNFYVMQIRMGRMTVDQVPARWYDRVLAVITREEDESNGSIDNL